MLDVLLSKLGRLVLGWCCDRSLENEHPLGQRICPPSRVPLPSTMEEPEAVWQDW